MFGLHSKAAQLSGHLKRVHLRSLMGEASSPQCGVAPGRVVWGGQGWCWENRSAELWAPGWDVDAAASVANPPDLPSEPRHPDLLLMVL